jgi:hypothetical protein
MSGKRYTISFDGKTIRSTEKMDSYARPMQIISAHAAELGITIGQQTIEEKRNEIPAMQELLQMLEIEGCMIVADALNCQCGINSAKNSRNDHQRERRLLIVGERESKDIE